MSSDPLLRVRGLTKHYVLRKGSFTARTEDVIKAVDGIDLDLAAGSTLGLVGESGSGKSTTGYCILQIIRPNSGTVEFMGRELTAFRGRELRLARREMQIVFQDPYSSLSPRHAIGRIVEEPLEAHGIGTRASRAREARELLDRVGLDPDLANRYPHEFSGGQRQRVGIARALALRPRLVVCDEPVSALDVSVQAQILNLLKDLQHDMGLTYLFISHDLAVVRAMSDEIAVMHQGRIVEHGPAERVYSHPEHSYTEALLRAVPIPDPQAMRKRKAERVRARSTEGEDRVTSDRA